MQGEDGAGRFSLSGVVNVISGGRERWIGCVVVLDRGEIVWDRVAWA